MNKRKPLNAEGEGFTFVQQVFVIEHLFCCNPLKALPAKRFSIGTAVENWKWRISSLIFK